MALEFRAPFAVFRSHLLSHLLLLPTDPHPNSRHSRRSSLGLTQSPAPAIASPALARTSTSATKASFRKVESGTVCWMKRPTSGHNVSAIPIKIFHLHSLLFLIKSLPLFNNLTVYALSVPICLTFADCSDLRFGPPVSQRSPRSVRSIRRASLAVSSL